MLRTMFAVLTAFFVFRGATAQDAASIAEIVPPLLKEYNVPGAAVAVIRDGEIVLVRGFGLLRAGEKAPVGERTVFQAASLSEPVVAYGTHLLVREGKLELDRPLSDYLESPYVDDPRIARITARIALSHTTGFPNWRPKKWTDDPELLEIEFDPGSRFQYSGEGYGYLQHVLKEVTGETLDVFFATRRVGASGDGGQLVRVGRAVRSRVRIAP
jgi:CubicO group peptidase (beta-lactamase class C family)